MTKKKQNSFSLTSSLHEKKKTNGVPVDLARNVAPLPQVSGNLVKLR